MEDGKIRILIAEDNELNLLILTGRLVRAGFAVADVPNGRECVAAVHADPPALILMDLYMPEMDGFEAIRILKEDPATCSIPIIVYSTSSHEADRERAFRLGCESYLVKPVIEDQLTAELERFLPGARLRTESRSRA